MNWIASTIQLVGTGISSFFGFKKQQSDALKAGLQVLSDVNTSNAQRETAIAQIISAEATSGYWLAAVWRPLLMLLFGAIIIARWLGYTPPNMTELEILEVYGLLKLGIGGYIGGRTLEKIVSNIGLGSALKKFIEKKIV